MLKLLGTINSPFTRKVRIALEEKGVAYQFVVTLTNAADVAVANPLAKVPVLVLPDNSSLYDSSVIVEYVDSLKETPKLVPVDFASRIAVRRLEALGDGMTEAAIAIAHDRRLAPERRQGAALEQKQMIKLRGGFEAVQRSLGDRSFAFGDGFTLADIVNNMAMSYCSRALADYDWRAEFPKLAGYAERVAARPSLMRMAAADRAR